MRFVSVFFRLVVFFFVILALLYLLLFGDSDIAISIADVTALRYPSKKFNDVALKLK